MNDFEKIYADYYDVVFMYVMKLCGNKELAEEITQDAFFEAMKNINSFRGECKLSVWLCQIAKNKFSTSVKRINRKVDYPLETIPSDEDLEQNLINKDIAFSVHKVLHLLGEPYKEIFWMRTFAELSFKEIGQLFSKTETWARVTYHRAKMKIKEEIQ